MSMFSIGLSGLNTAQIALNTTSNNISNVYTPGYNRELAIVEQKNHGGVGVIAVQRQFDYFIASQLNGSTSTLAALDSYYSQVSQIDNLLADQEVGLAPLMQKFFASLQALAATPSDPAARQGVIGAANTLTAQFRSFDSYLRDMQDGINGQIGAEVAQINNRLEQLAELNREIVVAAASQGEAPNSLLDMRDQIVAELSEHLDVRVSIQDGLTYNIALNNGQPLVTGTRAFSLEAMASTADPSRLVVGYNDGAGNRVELNDKVIKGGGLGGLLQFRSETLDKVQNSIGLMAVSLAVGFNDQHQLGIDLNGDFGEPFFAIGSPKVFSATGNAGTAVISAAYDDIAGLTGADYDIRVVDAATGELAITRRDSGETFTGTLDGSGQLAFAGVELTVDDPALLADGDSFQLQPTRLAAAEMDNLIHDTGKIAAAGPGGASGDNRNALALQDLQNAKLVGGRASLNQSYASLVGDVGIRTNIVGVNRAAQAGFTAQLQVAQQSLSGVNLDEEAANLIRYQRYYQANAKTIEVASILLDTILGLRA
ncbi:MAG: flagellar hook-associated protein FlgK [Porticoccaceae bacterium]